MNAILVKRGRHVDTHFFPGVACMILKQKWSLGSTPAPPCRCYLSWLHTQTDSHINLNAIATITAHSHKYTPQLATITQANTLWRPVVAVTVPCDQNGAQILIPHYARFKQPPLSLILSLYSPAPPQTPVSLSWPTQGPLDRSSTTAACVCVIVSQRQEKKAGPQDYMVPTGYK